MGLLGWALEKPWGAGQEKESRAEEHEGTLPASGAASARQERARAPHCSMAAEADSEAETWEGLAWQAAEVGFL